MSGRGSPIGCLWRTRRGSFARSEFTLL